MPHSTSPLLPALLFADGFRDEPSLDSFDRLGAARHAQAARELLSSLSAHPDATAALTTWGLTRRQLEVLRLVAQGLSNRDIAARLFLSEFTIRRHLANIYMKLHVSARAGAVARALHDKFV